MNSWINEKDRGPALKSANSAAAYSSKIKFENLDFIIRYECTWLLLPCVNVSCIKCLLHVFVVLLLFRFLEHLSHSSCFEVWIRLWKISIACRQFIMSISLWGFTFILYDVVSEGGGIMLVLSLESTFSSFLSLIFCLDNTVLSYRWNPFSLSEFEN